MPRVLNVDEMVVIALCQQRPELDTQVASSIIDRVRDYGQRLRDVAAPDDQPDKHLYQPTASVLWGDADTLVVYRADDFESVGQIVTSTGARLQEFIFGTP